MNAIKHNKQPHLYIRNIQILSDAADLIKYAHEFALLYFVVVITYSPQLSVALRDLSTHIFEGWFTDKVVVDFISQI